MSTNWDDASKTSEQSESHCSLAPASTCLCSCWWQTFRAYDVKMMWLTTRLTIFETLTASRVCGYSMIHYNVHVTTALLTAQSVTSKFTLLCFEYCRWSGYFLYSFLSHFFQDMPTNLYYNLFVFDQHREKNKLSRETRYRPISEFTDASNVSQTRLAEVSTYNAYYDNDRLKTLLLPFQLRRNVLFY